MLFWTFLSAAQAQPTSPEGAEAASPVRPPPSVWLEAGLAYHRGETDLEPGVRFGVRGVQPLSETTGIYAAFGLRGGLTLDVGGWFNFLPGPQDLFGFRSFAGAGLAYAEGSFGLALSAAVAYEVSPSAALTLVYTHRPLFLPELGQAFDVSLGVRLGLPGGSGETGRP